MLEMLGLSAKVEAVYRLMLANPQWGAVELAGNLGLHEMQIFETFETLADLALLQHSQTSDVPCAVGPQARLSRLLAEAETEMLIRQHQIEATGAAVSAIVAEQRSALQREEVVRLDGSEAVRERLAELASNASTCDTLSQGRVREPRGLKAGHETTIGALSRGITCRTVYGESARNEPLRWEHIQLLAEAGDQIRTVPIVPMQILIFDRSTALLPIDVNNPRAGGIEVGTGGLVAAMQVLFDQVWALATPLGESSATTGEGLTPQEKQLLILLSKGHTDEAAGRKLGLSARTVRRVVAGLASRLGAKSRFQAGAEATRRGWL